jgi:hypothetical protein
MAEKNEAHRVGDSEQSCTILRHPSHRPKQQLRRYRLLMLSFAALALTTGCGFDPNSRLLRAAEIGNESAARSALEHGADANVRAPAGKPALLLKGAEAAPAPAEPRRQFSNLILRVSL